MMFRDPYSERQELYRFLHKNVLFIGVAAVLAVVALAELALLFRLPAEARAARGQDIREKAAQSKVAGVREGRENPLSEDKASPGAPEGDWRLVLVNQEHPLPEDYPVRLAGLKNGLQFDERARDALERMLEAARAEGLRPVAASAYRSAEKQRELYENKVARLTDMGMEETRARTEAAREVAYPGTSEHQLGLAVDLVAYQYQQLDESQTDTEENAWLRTHCQEYGFILRYPTDKSAVTGVIHEPWHFRYVGTEAAGEIVKDGLCLEEYLERR